jgi:hypothetical protein
LLDAPARTGGAAYAAMVASDELISALWAARLFGCLSFCAQ